MALLIAFKLDFALTENKDQHRGLLWNLETKARFGD